MANNILMLMKLDADTMAFTSMVVSIVGALAAIFAAFYANIAAFYAKKAATRRDPDRGEQNPQHVEHSSGKISSIDAPIEPQVQRKASHAQTSQEVLHPQAEREVSPPEARQEVLRLQPQQEASQAQPQREVAQPQGRHISISVEGEAMGDVPLELFLTLQDSSIRVSRVEMLNGAGKPLSSWPSKATDNALVFKSTLAPKKVRQWWSAGDSTSEGGGRSVLRVYALADESKKEIYRDIPVSIVEELRSVGIASLIVWTVRGSI
jgi:hypothetical protein